MNTYKTLSNTARLIVDVHNGTFKAFSNASPEAANELLRTKINEMLPARNARGNFKHRELQQALPQIFNILEEVLEITITEAWKSDPFYRSMVDFRNLALGDRNEFLIPDGTMLAVNKFSGNTWDTDRHKLAGNQKISLETEWFVAHAYDDFERFLQGAIDVSTLLNAIAAAFNRHIDSMIANVFNDAATNLPTDFSHAGALATADMRELAQRVKTATRKNVSIMGTEMAVSQLNELQEVRYSEKMMNELHSTGRLGKWMGFTIIEIPQAFEVGTTNWVIDNDFLLLVPESDKFIKFVDEGETRAQEKTEQDNHDQTLSWQVQRKMGAGAVFGSAFGKYTII